jgi:hypothetical protein
MRHADDHGLQIGVAQCFKEGLPVSKRTETRTETLGQIAAIHGWRPNKGINRSAEQRRVGRCSVPAALRAAAPGYARR